MLVITSLKQIIMKSEKDNNDITPWYPALSDHKDFYHLLHWE